MPKTFGQSVREQPWTMKASLLGFILAGVGVGAGLSLEGIAPLWLKIITYGIVALGIAIGGVGVVFGFAHTLAGWMRRGGSDGDRQQY